ncbi:hypothetical protein [Bhargavaea changchunensis]|uniref:hypothetical protein n=1 Tax=Bhargavaea changchunensis TaxID=2134037 RepID=UPI003672BB1D
MQQNGIIIGMAASFSGGHGCCIGGISISGMTGGGAIGDSSFIGGGGGGGGGAIGDSSIGIIGGGAGIGAGFGFGAGFGTGFGAGFGGAGFGAGFGGAGFGAGFFIGGGGGAGVSSDDSISFFSLTGFFGRPSLYGCSAGGWPLPFFA